MSETALSRSIQGALERLGVWVIRVQSGTLAAQHGTTTRYIHCAEAGTPDLVVLSGSLVGFLEVKTAAGRLNRAQRAWHARAAQEGIRVAVVRSVSEAVSAVREWRSAS